jgi:ABC-type antimicrobial peptide transport system permease subunit
LYSPVQLDDMPEMNIVLKSSGAPDGFIPMLKSMVQGLDPKLFPEIRLLKSAFRQNMQSAEELALIMSLIGMAAMLLAGVGILGLVGYAVSQRTKEIAIRLALGSSKVQVAKSILRQFLWPVLLGVVGGAGSAAALSQILRRLLSGVSGLDPLSYVVAIAMLLGIFVLAAVPPARRALRLDVARALHQE